jgi:hypothetical protein
VGVGGVVGGAEDADMAEERLCLLLDDGRVDFAVGGVLVALAGGEDKGQVGLCQDACGGISEMSDWAARGIELSGVCSRGCVVRAQGSCGGLSKYEEGAWIEKRCMCEYIGGA